MNANPSNAPGIANEHCWLAMARNATQRTNEPTTHSPSVSNLTFRNVRAHTEISTVGDRAGFALRSKGDA